jgi:hypothetical protein
VYRLSLDPVAEDRINAIPQEALSPLAELFSLLETAPWSGAPFYPPTRGATCSLMPSVGLVLRLTWF